MGGVWRSLGVVRITMRAFNAGVLRESQLSARMAVARFAANGDAIVRSHSANTIDVMAAPVTPRRIVSSVPVLCPELTCMRRGWGRDSHPRQATVQPRFVRS